MIFKLKLIFWISSYFFNELNLEIGAELSKPFDIVHGKPFFCAFIFKSLAVKSIPIAI